jgi:hypothetical protein
VVEVVDLQIIQVLNQVELAVVEMDLEMMHLDDNRQLLEVLTLEAVEVVELLVILRAPAKAAAGGSGIVIVRAPNAVTLTASPGTNTISPTGSCTVATFTVSGRFDYFLNLDNFV